MNSNPSYNRLQLSFLVSCFILIPNFHSLTSVLCHKPGKIKSHDGSLSTNAFIPQGNLSSNYLLSTKWPLHTPSTHQRSTPNCVLPYLTWDNITSGSIQLINGIFLKTLLNSPSRHILRSFTTFPLDSRINSATRFPKHDEVNSCYVLFIYSTRCRFSLAAFPHINALARAYPQLKVVGVEVEHYMQHKWSLRMLFVPKLKIIVDDRIFNEFTGPDMVLDELIDFIWLNLRLLPIGLVGLKANDYLLVPQSTISNSYLWLAISWLITIMGLAYLCTFLLSSKLSWIYSIINSLKSNNRTNTSETSILIHEPAITNDE